MQLPDFLTFEPFNLLRDKMGADQLGSFEFFDPETQLTGDERSELSHCGIPIRTRKIRLLSDHSLAYKNSRIMVLTDGVAHVTNCDDLKLGSQVLIGTPGLFSAEVAPCKSCLHQLRYQGYDMLRERKQELSEKILSKFTFDTFFQHYPLYPVDVISKTIHYLSTIK